ncbi:MAG: hypothetical protein PVF58_10035 [Candidatus Methanofastidiosia archaeon]|jgi:hypothetical protein
MKNSEIVKKLFTKRELERNLQKSYYRMQENLKGKDYSVAAFYSFDVARIHQFLGKTKKAKYHYEKTLDHILPR